MALNFLDVLNREKEAVDNRSNETQRPKNEVLRVDFKDDKARTLLLRLLPSVSLLNGDEDGSFGVKERYIFFETFTTDDNGNPKKEYASLTLPTVPDKENETEKHVAKWRKNQMLPEGKFGFPKVRENYWFNVAKVVQKKTGMDYERDENGEVKVYALQATGSVYKLLLEKLMDPMADYSDNLEDAFMGFGASYPVKIAATSQTDRTVDIYSSSKVRLPEVDETVVREKLDDFISLTKPTDEVRPEWFETVKARVENGASATVPAGADTSDPFAGLGATMPADPTPTSFPDPFAEETPTKTVPDVSDDLPVVDKATQDELNDLLGDFENL